MAAGLFGNSAARSQSAPQVDPELLRRLMLEQEGRSAGVRTSGPVAVPDNAQPGLPRDAVVGPQSPIPALNTTISTGPASYQGADTPRPRPGMFANASRSASAMAAKGVLDDAMQQNGTGPATPSPTGFEALDNVPALNTTPNPNIADAQVQGRIHPKFFEHGGLGGQIAKIGAQALIGLGASTGNPIAMHYFTDKWADKNAQRQFGMWNAQHNVQRGEALDDREYEANQPRYLSGAQDQIKFDPTTGQSTRIYDAPRPEETYAAQFAEPGTPEYQSAMQDYVLRSYGPSAMDGRTDLADHRFQNSVALKGVPTYQALHPRAPAPRAPRMPTTGTVQADVLGKVARGSTLSPGEQDIYNVWKNGRRSGGSAPKAGASAGVSEGTTIKNPSTGQRMKMQGGQWVPVK